MNNYTVAVSRSFITQHFLIGGDWGAENTKHSHQYRIELQLTGDTLDQHGYLIDILDIENTLDILVESYSDRTLNELPEFNGINPSLEHFCRILSIWIDDRIQSNNVKQITVKIWESETAWSSYSLSR